MAEWSVRGQDSSFKQKVDRFLAEQAGGSVSMYLIRLIALSSMIGAIAFEAWYRFDDMFGHLSELLAVVMVIGFGGGLFFVVLFLAYQMSERSSPPTRRIHDRSW